MELSRENNQLLKHVDYFRKKTTPKKFDRTPNVPLIEGAVNVGEGGLQVYGIYSRRMVYREVVEVRSNYKKSYLW